MTADISLRRSITVSPLPFNRHKWQALRTELKGTQSPRNTKARLRAAF